MELTARVRILIARAIGQTFSRVCRAESKDDCVVAFHFYPPERGRFESPLSGSGQRGADETRRQLAVLPDEARCLHMAVLVEFYLDFYFRRRCNNPGPWVRQKWGHIGCSHIPRRRRTRRNNLREARFRCRWGW